MKSLDRRGACKIPQSIGVSCVDQSGFSISGISIAGKTTHRRRKPFYVTGIPPKGGIHHKSPSARLAKPN